MIAWFAMAEVRAGSAGGEIVIRFASARLTFGGGLRVYDAQARFFGLTWSTSVLERGKARRRLVSRAACGCVADRDHADHPAGILTGLGEDGSAIDCPIRHADLSLRERWPALPGLANELSRAPDESSRRYPQLLVLMLELRQTLFDLADRLARRGLPRHASPRADGNRPVFIPKSESLDTHRMFIR